MRIGVERKLKRDLLFFMHVDPNHFESIERYEPQDDVYASTVTSHLPDAWSTRRQGTWFVASAPDQTLPEQGFKLHVSATHADAVDVLERVVPVCVEHRASFKCKLDPVLHDLFNSKNANRGTSGKFVTVYPQTVDHFRTLAEALYAATEGVEGPYILSDTPYRDSKAVFWRYGGIRPQARLNAYGETETFLTTPDGTPVPDRRNAYFELPDWVEPPFGEDRSIPEETPVLNDRFHIARSMGFSNAGGVYLVEDAERRAEAVVKEARPRVDARTGSPDDAIASLRNEYEVLQRLADTSHTPEPLDFFYQWEHAFLAMERVSGMPLSSYRALEDVGLLLQPVFDEATVRRFCDTFNRVIRGLVRAVRACHAHDVVINDLSPNNVLLDRDTFEVSIIDLESAREVGTPVTPRNIFLTRGYIPPEKFADGPHATASFSDDVFAVGAVAYNLLFPAQNFFEINREADRLILDRIEQETGLPAYVGDVIDTLCVDRDIATAAEMLDARIEHGVGPITAPDPTRVYTTTDEVDDTLAGLAAHLEGAATPERTDRLWASDYRLYSTNPLGVAYGALGTSLFLKRETGRLPEGVRAWIDAQPLDPEAMPPGLYVGLGGAAWALDLLGLDRADAALDAAYTSPLRFSAPDFFYGEAGVGMTALYFWRQTGEDRHLDEARRSAEWLLDTATTDADGLSWPNLDGGTYVGLAHGASGVALFLLRLAQATGDERVLAAARRALAFDVAQGEPVPETGALKWPRVRGGSMYSPYWQYGGGGVGSTLIRFYDALGDASYRETARRAVRYADTPLALQPGRFTGTSSIGEFLLDVYTVTGDPDDYRRARRQANGLLYRIETEHGTAFPSDELLRISNGLAFGGAGVGLFLQRLRAPGPRLFHDLDATLDVHAASATRRHQGDSAPVDPDTVEVTNR